VAGPDIAASSGVGMKVAAVVVAVVAGISGAGWYAVSGDQEAIAPDTSSLFKGLPEDYFTQTEKTVVVKEKPIAAKVKVKKEEHVRTIIRYIPQAVQKPQIDYQAQRQQQEQLRQQQVREAINARRRGASGGYTLAKSSSENNDSQERWVNTAENYKDQTSSTVGRETSFPVDLNRTLTTDRNISAVLVEAINSELPGKIRAQIDTNVYAAHGRKILIPAGSMAVGMFAPLGKVGDSRLRAIWVRIIRPDGVNIVLSGAEMSDAMGRSGITGEVDTRLWERVGTALLVSTITTAAQYSVPVQNQNEANAVNNLGRDMTQVGTTILEQNIDLRPIVEIPAGSLIQITPTEDIWFKKPYKQTIYAEKVVR